jgi:hypothetical protein
MRFCARNYAVIKDCWESLMVELRTFSSMTVVYQRLELWVHEVCSINKVHFDSFGYDHLIEFLNYCKVNVLRLVGEFLVRKS